MKPLALNPTDPVVKAFEGQNEIFKATVWNILLFNTPVR